MSSNDFSSFLNGVSSTPLTVLNSSISFQNYISLDLSNSNSELKQLDLTSSSSLQAYIDSYLRDYNAEVAYGGYNEVRNIYRRSNHFNPMTTESERNIHLGIDLWTNLNSEIYTPLSGEVHSFQNNTNFGDYGPTIIMKHEVDSVIFYTLYGHLSLRSIASLEIGQIFQQGERIGTLGDASVNGDYPPHLHFQIIKDLGEWNGDYPGVCNRNDLEYYLGNCPNPNLLLKL